MCRTYGTAVTVVTVVTVATALFMCPEAAVPG